MWSIQSGDMIEWRIRSPKAAFVEQATLITLCVLATMYVERHILFDPHRYAGDTLLLEYWMRRFQDPSLFHDPLTQALIKTGYVPLGSQAMYWLASFVVDPIRFGAWGPLVLAPLSAWLVFRVIREHTQWIPAAWLGAALFILSWENQRFSGTHPRAFAQPIVLLTVFLLLRKRIRWAATVPAAGAFFYPPAALSAFGVLVLSRVGRRGRRLTYDRNALPAVGACAVAILAAYELPRAAGLSSGNLISESTARHYAEFGPYGQAVFFRGSVLSMLRANYSGFDITLGESILMVTAAVVLALGATRWHLIRKEVWAIAATSLALFGLSYAVLFHLYLPSRYTYPLIPFYCIVIAVLWHPVWSTCAERTRWLLPGLAVCAPVVLVWYAGTRFVLGPSLSARSLWSIVDGGWIRIACALAAGLVLAMVVYLQRIEKGLTFVVVTICAILSGAVMTGVTAEASWQPSKGHDCSNNLPLYQFLRTLPKQAIIAGDPRVVDCVPIEADRAVVISVKLYQPFDYTFLKVVRPRMADMLRAYYGPSREAIDDLGSRYGATDLVVNLAPRSRRRVEAAFTHMAPFGALIGRVFQGPSTRAVLHLPRACEVWRQRHLAVYDISCVRRSPMRGSS